MSDGAVDLRDEARAAVWRLPLETLDPAQPALFRDDAFWPYFERLRAEDLVHHMPNTFVKGYEDLEVIIPARH